ncbi:MAG: hypothetical protein V3R94_05590 [Acidobacteriota bacterium]
MVPALGAGQDGYRLVYIADQDVVVTVAGFRLLNNLGLGKFLYVDDMVTDQEQRSKGFGKVIEWLIGEAGTANANTLIWTQEFRRRMHIGSMREKE